MIDGEQQRVRQILDVAKRDQAEPVVGDDQEWSTIEHTPRYFAFRYQSAEHFVEVFRTFYGPVHKAFLALDATGQAALEADLLALLRRANSGGERGLVVQAEYLETVITK